MSEPKAYQKTFKKSEGNRGKDVLRDERSEYAPKGEFMNLHEGKSKLTFNLTIVLTTPIIPLTLLIFLSKGQWTYTTFLHFLFYSF